MSEKKEKEEILEQISKIRESYTAKPVDIESEEMSFLDRLNELVRAILGDDSASIYQALNRDSLEKWNKTRYLRAVKKFFINNTQNALYFCLLATITMFLVSEALDFYAVKGLISTKTYVKAILTEVCFIFLSGFRSSGILQTLWVNSLRLSIFCLMAFVITSQTLVIGTKGGSESIAIQEQISIIETQVKEKTKEIEYYRDVKNWPLTTKKLIEEKSKLVDKLMVLKKAQQSGKNQSVTEIEKYKMYGKAVFRVLLLFISVLITRRIFSF